MKRKQTSSSKQATGYKNTEQDHFTNANSGRILGIDRDMQPGKKIN